MKFEDEERKYETNNDNDSINPAIYVEERIKMLKSYQNNETYRCLKELWKQIKEFKLVLINNLNYNELISSRFSRKQLWLSFSDEEEIEKILNSDSFKINTRSVLGVKNNNDWIYGLNIGNIMHLTPLLFNEIKDDMFEEESEEK